MLPFAATIFSGAFLLFLVQPLVARFILPWFGGSPSVWTTCMLFFQVFLLLGYLYSHLLQRIASPRRQAVVHGCLLALCFPFLPIVPDAAWRSDTGVAPVLRILGLLCVTVGVPYLLLAATSPLLQAWFGAAHPGRSPYRLYALSNVGSLLALLAYPLAMEVLLPRYDQALVWSAGFLLFAVFTVITATRLPRTALVRPAAESSRVGDVLGTPRAGDRWLWLALPACASIMLLAMTNQMCQDVAPIPFLWVLPLGLYLLTFILCFDGDDWYSRRLYIPALVLVLALDARFLLFNSRVPLAFQISVFACSLFVICMFCHGELARLRPHPRHLTSYYLMIALGGALGGLLVGAAAPIVFDSYAELPIGLLACAALVMVCLYRDPTSTLHRGSRPHVWAAAVAGLLILGAALGWRQVTLGRDVLWQERSFYGVLRLVESTEHAPPEATRGLYHGEILHGLQFVDDQRRNEPTTYYAPGSGVSIAFDQLDTTPRHVGIIGLGAGTLAAYGRPEDRFRFYEIDPTVCEVAKSSFTFLADSPATTEVVLGDARLSLEHEPSQQFDLMVLDAFAGDSIPVHLLTEQAFALYRHHVRDDGLIAVHISNRHLDLEPLVRGLAARTGMHASARIDATLDPSIGRFGSSYVLVSPQRDAIERLGPEHERQVAQLDADAVVWTDDRASLLQVVR